jgi:SAM-dependent methyltransferase
MVPHNQKDVAMAAPTIQFNDGAAYDRMMGVWSRMVGEIFLDWLVPEPGLTWADIGCGSGAFSTLLAARCQPAKIHGIDPSEAQLTHARTGPAALVSEFRQGDAMALPYPDHSIDAATMALVLFFVPDPAKGIAEMLRVVKPGGIVSAYVWDISGGGVPFEPINAELGPTGMAPALPPNVPISRMDALRMAWDAAGLEQIESRVIRVRRTFADFAEFWAITTSSATIGPTIAALAPDVSASLQARVRARLPVAVDGTVSYESGANAIKGRKPLPV